MNECPSRPSSRSFVDVSFGMAEQETIDAMTTAASTANGTVQLDEKTINEMTSAAANADDATLKRILDGAPPGTVNRPNKYRRTAIQVMDYDSPSTARILIDHGADLDRPDPSVHRTILHDTAERGLLATLNLLLEHGANATARDNMGNTPAHLAAKEGGSYRIEILDRLSQNCTLAEVNAAGKTPLDLANEGNHGEIVKWLQDFCM